MNVYIPKATTYARFVTLKSHIWTLEAYIDTFASSLLSVAVEKFTYLFIDLFIIKSLFLFFQTQQKLTN